MSAAKLPILNPNEFDLWKMRIEQYFLMTDYSLCEVILNGDSLIPTRVIEGVVQPVAPTTVKQRLAMKIELKARGTLLMALPDKHQLKFNIHKDAKTLMEAKKKQFGGNKETKKKLISQLEILGESLSQEDINLKFLRSLPNKRRTHTLIWRNKTDLEDQSLDDLFNSLKIYEVHVSALPNVDTLSDAVIYSFFASQSNSPQLDNDDLKKIDADDLEEIDLKCYDWSFQAEEEPTNYALMAFTSSSSSSSDNELRDNALVVLRKKFEKAKQERDELKLKLEKFQTSSINLSQLLASQTNDKTKLGYDNHVFDSSVFDCDEMSSSESDVSMPASPIYNRYQSGEGYHVVPPPYTGTFIPLKPDLVFHDALTVNEIIHIAFNVKLSPTKPDKDLSLRPLASIINDWVSNSKDDYEAKPLQNDPSFVQPTEQVKIPRHSVQIVEHIIQADHPGKDFPKSNGHRNSRNRKACFMLLTRSKLVPLTAARLVTALVPHHNVIRPRPAKPVGTKPHSPPRRTINHRPLPPACNFPLKVTTTKAPKFNAVKGEIQVSYGLGPKEALTFLFLKQGNPHHALKDKGVINSGCSRHMTGNMSYLTDFKEINGGYVAFGRNPKSGKITRKGKIRIGKLEFDDVYCVNELKFNLFSVSQMCDKKNIVLFTDTECIVLSPDFKMPDEN
nr:ribonuclease H-like domain-containing protein [Tanacetum cinerariifolium]